MGRSPERTAANEARFRQANEQIHEQVVELAGGRPAPYLCECEEPGCTTVVLLTAADYEDVRSTPRRFAVASGHEGEDDRVVDRREGYTVIEKRAAEV